MSGFITHKESETDWVSTKLLKMEDIGPDSRWQYELLLPSWLSEKDIWAVWEKERFLSMQENLKQGDVVFDVGSECGVMSAILAQFVGGENMVLFEPSSTWWSLIRAIWNKNGLKPPKDAFMGLVGDETLNIDLDVEAQIKDGWPNIAYNGELCVTTSYRYLHEPMHKAVLQNITLDDYYAFKGFYPDAITIDVEGAELLVLKGARKVLEKFHPKVWVSVHPDLALKDYGTKEGGVVEFMNQSGYVCEVLAIDHETHVYCNYENSKGGYV